jgi:hypothetical protein
MNAAAAERKPPAGVPTNLGEEFHRAIVENGIPIDAQVFRDPRIRAKVVEMYPSLAAPPREHLIPFSARIPLSMIDELSATCVQRKIDKSALVRDFIAAGLRSLKEHG